MRERTAPALSAERGGKTPFGWMMPDDVRLKAGDAPFVIDWK
jgi:hypothetical protein